MTLHDDHDRLDDALKALLGDDAPADVQRRCGARFDGWERQLRDQPAPPVRRGRFFLLRPAWAGGGFAVSLAVLAAVFLLMSNSRPSWADVVSSFKAVRHFSATIYITEDPVKPPEKIELWRSGDGRIRLHCRGLIFFGKGGRLLKVFHVDNSAQEVDIGRLSRAEKNELGLDKPLGILETMGSMEELSLNRVLELFCGKKVISAPIPNSEASIGTDMQVFDVTTDANPAWTRVWALRSSSLPVRFRSFDPRDGDSVDAVVEYMKEQPAAAFDPDAFRKAIRKTSGDSNRVYALLRDPGGRNLNPGGLFKETGYHMPELRRIGRTPEGVVWVESANGQNRTPDGRPFFGFGKLTDNLGQQYLHCEMRHEAKNDVVVEYFVPANYRLDYRTPTTYTLTCWSQPDHFRQTDAVVGSIDVAKWEESGFPKEHDAPDSGQLLRVAIESARDRADWARFDALLGKIPGEPETSALARFREEQRLDKLTEMGRRDEAFAIAERLYAIYKPLIAKNPWSAREVAASYIKELVRRGRTGDASIAVSEFIAAARQNRENKQAYVFFVSELYTQLRDARGNAPLADVVKLFPSGVLDEAEIRERIAQLGGGGGQTVEDLKVSPRLAAWRKYLDRLGEQYGSKPLPADVEFLTGAEAFNEDALTLTMDLPGHPDYSVIRLPEKWAAIVRGEAWRKNWDPALIRATGQLGGEKIQAVCVVKKSGAEGDDYRRAIAAFMKRTGVEIAATSVTRTVWVARYDGRKLPYWRDVKPLEIDDATTRPFIRAGGTSTTAHELLKMFMYSINRTMEPVLDDSTVYIADETGLPQKPGANQTWANICPCSEYRFWSGADGVERARQWFRENFGITFAAEARTLTVHEARRIP